MNMPAHFNKSLKSFIAGIVGMFLLILFYWLILFLATQDLWHPLRQFFEFKYWIIALVLGFGIQTSLFWYTRSGIHLQDNSLKTAIATSTTTSSMAMIACCAHHLTDLLPILGFSAAALFLSKYQTYFFLFGIISNILGIILMLHIIKTKKHFNLLTLFKSKKTCSSKLIN